MNTYDHAQQIYSMMIAGWAASGRPLPGAEEAKRWAESAMLYAQSFYDQNSNTTKSRV